MLDEPLTGLDPRQRLAMIELFEQLGADGPLRGRLEPRARRGRAVRVARARDGAGPSGRRGRLPGHPRPHGRPAAPGPHPHRPGPRAGHGAHRHRIACWPSRSRPTTRVVVETTTVHRLRHRVAAVPLVAQQAQARSPRSRRSTTISRACSATWWPDERRTPPAESRPWAPALYRLMLRNQVTRARVCRIGALGLVGVIVGDRDRPKRTRSSTLHRGARVRQHLRHLAARAGGHAGLRVRRARRPDRGRNPRVPLAAAGGALAHHGRRRGSRPSPSPGRSSRCRWP